MWMIQRVSIGILKIAGAVIIAGFIFWSIWGVETDTKKENNSIEEKITNKSLPKKKHIKNDDKKSSNNIEVENKEGIINKIFGGKEDDKRIIPAVIVKKDPKTNKVNNVNTSSHTAGVQIIAWNYWSEKDRLRKQKDTIGEVLIWTNNSSALFDVPFVNQVSGKNDLERERKVLVLISTVKELLKKAEFLQTKLLTEINEFSAKANIYHQDELIYEEKFLNAMNQSDPSGIDHFLEGKIEAEKKQTANGIEAESRKILSEKVDSYAQVLINLREYLIANKKALIKDVQVVAFPEDPFHRIISIEEWGNSGLHK